MIQLDYKNPQLEIGFLMTKTGNYTLFINNITEEERCIYNVKYRYYFR